ncbi:Like-Sm ribonucleoprotein, core [Acidilobus saccharovorans 345-15]|uniref:Like-Sm ribonucleoprotein, core n=1 Tax=Acidilobus saccharovorans (strain DSM 16705 / JCM 18335 / VKM B-2471 / 345-15) TaxID=666510 RepID=D9Q078_ACIS3|nr:Lsm family RNA-binding protein [Acidilobus saccharovorans]ADL18716.1 Like-Sm ribonucleoprotein, core [Acidilobus saccharovorans 345-15]
MSIATEPARRFTAKLNSLIDHVVIVTTSDGKTYTGKLTGFDPSTLSVVIEEAKDSSGNQWPIIIISGSRLAEIKVGESEVFNAKEFMEFLLRFGNIDRSQVKVYEDANVVEVSRTIRVSKNGVEGSGPLAQKVNTLFREYLRTKGVVIS